MIDRKILLAAAAAGMIAIGAAPSIAGEVTGNDEQVDANGRSICKFSGLNDGHPPAGHTQTYGQDVREDRVDPTEFDPEDPFAEHPGWFCNPNNFDAREILPR